MFGICTGKFIQTDSNSDLYQVLKYSSNSHLSKFLLPPFSTNLNNKKKISFLNSMSEGEIEGTISTRLLGSPQRHEDRMPIH